MATSSQPLTLSEFEIQFAHQKPYYEFWNGEAIQKSVPNSIHGLLQGILRDILRNAGYKAASEVKLKISKNVQPVPDIIATMGRVEVPYPTKPVEIVIEVLSDDDPMSLLLSKCRTYRDWGFKEIYVVDPVPQLVFRWLDHRLEEVSVFAGQPVSSIWIPLAQELT